MDAFLLDLNQHGVIGAGDIERSAKIRLKTTGGFNATC